MTAGWRSRFSAGRLKLTAWRTPRRRCRTGCGVSASTLRPLPPPCCSSWIYFLLSQRQERQKRSKTDGNFTGQDGLNSGQTAMRRRPNVWTAVTSDMSWQDSRSSVGTQLKSLLTLKSVSALQSVFLIVSLLHFKLLDHFLTQTWLMMCIDA